MDKVHTRSLGNSMPKPVKMAYYAAVLFGNIIVNKIPSRHIRRWFYQMMGADFDRGTFPCRRVEMLFPKGLKLSDGVAIGCI